MIKHDDIHLRWDYSEANGRFRNAMRTKYATIENIFEHQMFPGGPMRVIVEVSWYTTVGKRPISGIPIVKVDVDAPFNTEQKFLFLDNCYQEPVAVWPHDPLNKLAEDDVYKGYFNVIDRNQTEDFDA